VFSGGSAGVTISGNIVRGGVSGAAGGWIIGTGLADFTLVTWDAKRRNALPSPNSAILGSGDPAWETLYDITGFLRTGTVEAGCYDAH
jgi:hypothetical protein